MIKWMVVGAWAAILAGACNDVGTCPSADSITPGASCSGESLECAYTLQTPSPACDGTSVEGGIATSCVCTSGAWVCPSPVACPGPPGPGGDDGGGADASVGEDAGGKDVGAEGAAGDGAAAE
jgi:hypothetical protein